MTKISEVQFINPVSFGGQITSANGRVVGDRAGAVPADIELDEEQTFIKLSRVMNGKMRVKFVPMTNVSGFEILEEVAKPVAPSVKK